jgi:hypothetical protein
LEKEGEDMTPEGLIKKEFNKGLKELQERYGKLMVRMPVSRGMGKPLLDYLLCANGRFVLVEAKRDVKHDLTPQQKRTRDECLAAGGEVLVVYDATSINQILRYIECICHQ